MVLARQFNPVARAILVIGAVMALVTGVTFAALSDSVVLEGNTIASANADLKIWDGDSFEESAPGFAVTGLVPGEGSDEYFFYLLNDGDSALDLTAMVPSEPEVPTDGYDFTGWENLKVTFTSHEAGCVDNTVETDMAALLAGEVDLPCNPFAEDAQGNNQPGEEDTEGNFSVSFDIDPDAVDGDNPAVGAFDIVINGTVASEETEI